MLLFALLLPGSDRVAVGQGASRPVIVSPVRPHDSLGETVYQQQGKKDKDEAVIPGVLSDPEPIKTPNPKYSKAMRKAHFEGTVKVDGIISQSGEMIDLEVVQPADPDAAQAALKAVSQYKFRPAKLDGKPVATRLIVEVEFRIYY